MPQRNPRALTIASIWRPSESICNRLHNHAESLHDVCRGRRCQRICRWRDPAAAPRPSGLCRRAADHRCTDRRGQCRTTIAEHHPHLLPLADRVLDATDVDVLAGHDVVFLGAAARAFRRALAEQLGPDTVVIDCGADFRLTDAAAWEQFYGSAHAGSWPYGLPELPGGARPAAGRQAHRRARLLSDRGTAGAAGPRSPRTSSSRPSPSSPSAAPPARAEPPRPTCSARRSSGRRAPTTSAASTGTPPRSPRACNAVTDKDVTVSFTPVLIPTSRGILATCTATHHRAAVATARRLRKGLRRRAVRAPAARGPAAEDRRGDRQQRRAASRSPSTRTPRRSSRSPRSTTSSRAPAARPCSR